jgi:hypothetical protein
VREVLQDPDATTYQFVVRAVPDDAHAAVAGMRAQFELREEAAEARVQQEQARAAAAEERTAQVQAACDAQLLELREQLEATQRELAAARRELQATHDLRTMRATRGARSVYGAVRRLRG